MFEFFVGDDGFVFDPGLVCIDGVDGILEDAGDLFVFVDAHADEREDAKVGVEEFVVFQLDLIFFGEQVVEALNKIREEFEEHLVEILQQLFLVLF